MQHVMLDNALHALSELDSGSVPLVYVDPPFSTGKVQSLQSVSNGIPVDDLYSYNDKFDDYIGWLTPHLRQAYRVLAPNGTMILHLNWREVHYAKIVMDTIFGRANFLNEVIWTWDYGARAKRHWPRKHDNLLVYVKTVSDYTFNYDAMDRIPYAAPSLQTKERAELGKTPTDTQFITIVSTVGYERTGYVNQKPVALLHKLVKVHSNPGDLVVDFFAGSGTTGQAALDTGRDFILVDDNPQAFDVMRQRFSYAHSITYEDRLRVGRE